MADPVAVEGLHKRWPGGAEALVGVDLAVRPGELVLLRGANGSGKSTLLAILAGLVRPSGGAVRVLGGGWGDAEARRHLGYVEEAPALPARWRVSDLLYVGARLSEVETPAAAAAAWTRRLALDEVAEQRAGTLSQGTVKRVALALALLHAPRLLLLDEPLSALDEPSRAVALDAVADACADGAAALVATHWPEAFTGRATRSLHLHRGTLVQP